MNLLLCILDIFGIHDWEYYQTFVGNCLFLESRQCKRCNIIQTYNKDSFLFKWHNGTTGTVYMKEL